MGGISDAVGGGVDLGSGYLSVSTRREEGVGFTLTSRRHKGDAALLSFFSCFVFSIIIIS